MEPAAGRRPVRSALTLGTALTALVVVALAGDPGRLRSHALFVVVTGTLLVLVTLGRPATRRSP